MIAYNILSQRDHRRLRELDFLDSTETRTQQRTLCWIISCYYNGNKALNLWDFTLNATHTSVMRSSTLNTDMLNTNWGKEGQAGFFSHPNSCAGILVTFLWPSPISSRDCSSVLRCMQRDSVFGCVLKLPWLNMDWFSPTHCCDIHLLCLLRLNKSKWKFTLLSPRYILNSPCSSEGCSSNQWLHWSLLTLLALHTCEIRSKHKIIFNGRFCMVSRSL